MTIDSDDHPIYNHTYYQTTNYHDYDGARYRAYHLSRYLWLGLIYKHLFGVRRILDMGCATGMSVWVFRRLLGMEAYGVDVSRYAIANGVESIRPYLSRADITREALPYHQRFDLVVSYDVFEHLPPEALPGVMSKVFSVTDKAVLGIYVLDEPIAMWHNWFNKPHADHLCERTSAWWIDTLSSLGYVATHLPLARKGTLLVRPRSKWRSH
ncbi:MAG TPA: class I SAM-dependent methyltransferase [Anaerolineales bacterium]|nr:class I SAM-dependent methyltransferase [Anaerolineales bacterium]